MPTLDEIQKIHDMYGHKNTLGSYLQALRDIGVKKYSTYIRDGHSEYVCSDGTIVKSQSVHDVYVISAKIDKAQFLKTMQASNDGKMDYFEMSKGFADSGIERWEFTTDDRTISYFDTKNNVIYAEGVTDKGH